MAASKITFEIKIKKWAIPILYALVFLRLDSFVGRWAYTVTGPK